MIYSKSALLKGLGDWDYDEISIQNPNQDQVLVKVIQCGICSTDVVRSMEVGFYNYPIVPGHEIIGKIYKIGKNQSGYKEGDKVCVYPLITCGSPDCCGNSVSAYGLQKNPNLCSKYDFLGSRSHGGYSEYILAPIKSLVKIPDNLNDLEKKPEAFNLINIYSNLTNKSLEQSLNELKGKEYSYLKNKLSEVLVEVICPIGKKIRKLLDDKSYLEKILKEGTDKAANIAEYNLKEIRNAVGFF